MVHHPSLTCPFLCPQHSATNQTQRGKESTMTILPYVTQQCLDKEEELQSCLWNKETTCSVKAEAVHYSFNSGQLIAP